MAPLRTIEFDKELNAHILRDTRASVHAILHLQEPFPASGATARDGAEEYLRAHAATLGINDSELTNLHLFPDDAPSGTDVEYRFLSEKRQFDVTTVTFQQTKSGLPVWKAGIAVHLKQQAGNINVVCAQTARDTDINSPGPVAAAEPPL